MEFKVNCGIWGAMFGVPIIVADNFLKLATGEQIKVLLYLLRCSGKMCSSEEISANTGVTVQQAEDAVLFWQQANVLSPQTTGISPSVNSLMMQPPVQQPKAQPQPEQTAQPAVVQKTAEPVPDHKLNLSGSEIAEIMNDSQDIKELFKITETILGPLKNSQMNSIIWMYDHLGLKKEVIITLLSYCASIEKTNTAYVEKIASVWAENDINSMSAAQDEIQKLSASNDYISNVARALELKHPPTTMQKKYFEEWKQAGLSIELIQYAYEKAIEYGVKSPFPYANKILLSWRNNGFTTVQDVKENENDFRKKKAFPKNTDTSSNADEYKFVINDFKY